VEPLRSTPSSELGLHSLLPSSFGLLLRLQRLSFLLQKISFVVTCRLLTPSSLYSFKRMIISVVLPLCTVWFAVCISHTFPLAQIASPPHHRAKTAPAMRGVSIAMAVSAAAAAFFGSTIALPDEVGVGNATAVNSTDPPAQKDTVEAISSSFWYSNISHINSTTPDIDDTAGQYKVYREVKEGDGADAIQEAIRGSGYGNGKRHPMWMASQPRVVYFRPGEYFIDKTIYMNTDTVLMGDANNVRATRCRCVFFFVLIMLPASHFERHARLDRRAHTALRTRPRDGREGREFLHRGSEKSGVEYDKGRRHRGIHCSELGRCSGFLPVKGADCHATL